MTSTIYGNCPIKAALTVRFFIASEHLFAAFLYCNRNSGVWYVWYSFHLVLLIDNSLRICLGWSFGADTCFDCLKKDKVINSLLYYNIKSLPQLLSWSTVTKRSMPIYTRQKIANTIPVCSGKISLTWQFNSVSDSVEFSVSTFWRPVFLRNLLHWETTKLATTQSWYTKSIPFKTNWTFTQTTSLTKPTGLISFYKNCSCNII